MEAEKLLREIWDNLKDLEDLYEHDELTKFEIKTFNKLKVYFESEGIDS